MKKRRDKKRSESGASADGRGERTTRISGFCVEGLGRNVRVGGRGKAGGDKGKVGMNRVLLAKNRLIRVRSGSITCYCTVFATADIVALNGTYTSRTQLEVMQSKTTKQRACLDDVLFVGVLQARTDHFRTPPLLFLHRRFPHRVHASGTYRLQAEQ